MLKEQVQQLREQLEKKEESLLRAKSGSEKELALLEQKVQFLEKENRNL